VNYDTALSSYTSGASAREGGLDGGASRGGRGACLHMNGGNAGPRIHARSILIPAYIASALPVGVCLYGLRGLPVGREGEERMAQTRLKEGRKEGLLRECVGLVLLSAHLKVFRLNEGESLHTTHTRPKTQGQGGES